MILARGRRVRGSFGGRRSDRVSSSPFGLVLGRLGGPPRAPSKSVEPQYAATNGVFRPWVM
jgi:hypothetical protein